MHLQLLRNIGVTITSVGDNNDFFENVGFRYPQTNKWVLRGINFTLYPSEKLALVGEMDKVES